MPLVELEISTQQKAESLMNVMKLEKKEVVQARLVRVRFYHHSSSNTKHR
jgi:hypothetical protein